MDLLIKQDSTIRVEVQVSKDEATGLPMLVPMSLIEEQEKAGLSSYRDEGGTIEWVEFELPTWQAQQHIDTLSLKYNAEFEIKEYLSSELSRQFIAGSDDKPVSKQ